MQFARVFKKSKHLITFVFPFLLLLGVVSILFGESHTSFVFSILLPLLVLLNTFQFIFLLINRKKKAIYNLVVVLLFFSCFDSFYQFNLKKTKKPKGTFSLMSYNTNSFRHDSVMNNGIIDVIKRIKPDILIFQEFSYLELDNLKMYPFYFLGYRDDVSKSMQAVLSKYPIINKGYIDFDNTMNNSMFVDVIIKGKPIRVYNVHLESYRTTLMHNIDSPRIFKPLFQRVFQADKVRVTQAKIVQKHIKSYKGNVIVLGDFNCTQYAPAYQVLKDSKKDTFVEAGKGFGGTYELFNYPFKIDHILVEESFEVINHQNFDINLSDHEPVLAEIKFKD